MTRVPVANTAMLTATIAATMLVACGRSDTNASVSPGAPQTVRVAVIGGMTETGFWQELTERYERASGNKIEIEATGPKPQVIAAFRKGGIDLITVHSSDAMVNLVADGLARDPLPWVRNDFVIVGPSADPAKIRGGHDAVAALAKIVAAKAPLLVHASMGADGVLHDLEETGGFKLDPVTTILFTGGNQHEVLARAASLGAYTLVGRIPVLIGKLKADGIEVMVTGDPQLRRPFLVEVAVDARPAAIELAAFLRSPPTQEWIATYGKGKYDDQPLFFPVTLR